MTIYRVDEHHVTHTCPSDPNPHPVDVRRTVVHTIPGRACMTPVTIRTGDTTATVPCGQVEPSERQCGACRTVIVINATTTEHIGPETPNPTGKRPATGYAVNPCDCCGQRLAAVLADVGRHILCHPYIPLRSAPYRRVA